MCLEVRSVLGLLRQTHTVLWLCYNHWPSHGGGGPLFGSEPVVIFVQTGEKFGERGRKRMQQTLDFKVFETTFLLMTFGLRNVEERCL